MSLPKEGNKAPNFNAPATTGQAKLSDFKGKNLVLYFYPKDDTPGCTVEACGFRDEYKTIKKHADILGVSPDPIKKHDKFIEKYDLPFPLLSDEDHKVSEAYGVWVEKNMYGRKYMGVQRSTFIIDKNGKLAKVFPKVKPKEHTDEVLAAVQSL